MTESIINILHLFVAISGFISLAFYALIIADITLFKSGKYIDTSFFFSLFVLISVFIIGKFGALDGMGIFILVMAFPAFLLLPVSLLCAIWYRWYWKKSSGVH